MVIAIGYYTVLMATGEQAPSSVNGVCESIGLDGDTSVWTDLVHLVTGVGSGKMVSGAGKFVGTDLNPTCKQRFRSTTPTASMILNGNPYSLTAKD